MEQEQVDHFRKDDFLWPKLVSKTHFRLRRLIALPSITLKWGSGDWKKMELNTWGKDLMSGMFLWTAIQLG